MDAPQGEKRFELEEALEEIMSEVAEELEMEEPGEERVLHDRSFVMEAFAMVPFEPHLLRSDQKDCLQFGHGPCPVVA